MKLKTLGFIVIIGMSVLLGSGWVGLSVGQAQELASNTEKIEESVSEIEEKSDDDFEGFEEDNGFHEFGDFEEDQSSFENSEIEIQDVSTSPSKQYSFTGFVKEALAFSPYKTDSDYNFVRKDAEISKIRTTLNLQFYTKMFEEWKLVVSGNAFYDDYYHQKGSDQYTEEALENHESEFELRDTFLEGPITPALRLKIGRQINAWGESDFFRITDWANPHDNREMGQTDMEDARLPVLATKLSYSLNNLEISGVAIHEIRPTKVGSEGTDYDPYITYRDGSNPTFQKEDVPKNTTENTEWLFRIFNSFNGGDLSFVYADVFDDEAYLAYETATNSFIPSFKRIQVLGLAGNLVKESWLLKTEVAQINGKALMRNDLTEQLTEQLTKQLTGQLTQGENDPMSWSEKDIRQTMIGVEYAGITDLVVTIEANRSQIEAYEDNIYNDEVSDSYGLRIRYDALNQTLQPRFSWINIANNNGSIYRLNVDYDYIDALQLSGGVVIFNATDENDSLYPYRYNDRIFCSVKYSFSG
jgi:hypothetical protein